MIRDVMHYDFTKVQKAMKRRDLTLADISRLTGGAVPVSTVWAALERSAAYPRTARAISRAVGIPYKDILVKEESVA